MQSFIIKQQYDVRKKNKRLKVCNLCITSSFCAIFMSSIHFITFLCHLCRHLYLLFVFHQIITLRTLRFVGRCTSSSFVFKFTIALFVLFIECVFIVGFTSIVCTQLHNFLFVFYVNSLQ